MAVRDNGEIKRKDATYCCESCYSRDRYLDGIVGNKIEGSYLARLEAKLPLETGVHR